MNTAVDSSRNNFTTPKNGAYCSYRNSDSSTRERSSQSYCALPLKRLLALFQARGAVRLEL